MPTPVAEARSAGYSQTGIATTVDVTAFGVAGGTMVFAERIDSAIPHGNALVAAVPVDDVVAFIQGA